MARKVSAADGTEWRVGREWFPWRRKLRDELPDLSSVPDLGGLDELPVLIAAVLLVVVLAISVVVGFFVLAVALELLLLLAGFVIGLFGRVVLRRPWTVRARSRQGAEHAWRVRGWRASGELIDEVASALAGRQPLPAGAVSLAAPQAEPEPEPAAR